MWLQTGPYHLAGLVWLIIIAVVVIVALIALAMASSAMARSRTAARGKYDQTAISSPNPVGLQVNEPDSLKILDERYARGEISREEYAERKTDLSKQWKG